MKCYLETCLLHACPIDALIRSGLFLQITSAVFCEAVILTPQLTTKITSIAYRLAEIDKENQRKTSSPAQIGTYDQDRPLSAPSVIIFVDRKNDVTI